MDVVLAGDVGGRKTDLALYAADAPSLRIQRERTYDSTSFSSLGEVVARFLDGCQERVVAAAFGVPGPVIDGLLVTTNLPWEGVEADAIGEQIGGAPVVLMNDLVAMAHGALSCPPSGFAVLNPGLPRQGDRVVIAAGTGLGHAILHTAGGKDFVAVPTEGGHADFAPSDEAGIGFLQYMRTELGGHVSWERLVSGPGLANGWRFVTTRLGIDASTAVRQQLPSARDPAAVIAEAALAETCKASVRALDLWLRYYGAYAGNVALGAMAVGGVSLGGGMAVKLKSALERGGLTGPFMEAFRDKGRYARRMSEIGVRVILDPKVSLIGAAREALGKRK